MDNSLLTVIAPILLMALFGVPHGALDAALIRMTVPKNRYALTIGTYIAIAIFCIVVWFLAPTAAMLFFLAISAWHFGSSDIVDSQTRDPILQIIARGGIWTLFLPLIHWDSTEPIFAQLSTNPALIKVSLAATFPVWILACTTLLYTESVARNYTALALPICSLILVAVLPPLWSLGLYFCLWHARRHTQRTLAQISNATSAKRLGQRITMLTLGIAAAAFAVMPSDITIDTAITRIFFVGIFALTVPHMALIDYYLPRTHPRGTHL
jgi:Brp/Blh family beta-carotene 15,15'-monooxygenase